MNLNGRITALENATRSGNLPRLVLTQDWTDLDLYHGPAGETYRVGAENWPDENTCELVLITFSDNWREEKKGWNVVNLTWGDNDNENQN